MNEFEKLFETGESFAGEKYKIGKILGKGAMGMVFKAKNMVLHTDCAIKILLPIEGMPDEDFQLYRELFIIEARKLKKISPHKNIIQVFNVDLVDIGKFKKLPYMEMTYVEGETLKNWMRFRPLPCRINISHQYIEKICEGLSVAHEVTIHRDLKTENIIIPGTGEPIILDFGVSTSKSSEEDSADPFHSATQQLNRAVVGTPKYRAPEQVDFNSDVDARADVYSFAIMVYEMLTGQFPAIDFEKVNGFKKAVCIENVKDPSDLNPRLSTQIDDVIKKAMSIEKEERHASITEFSKAVADAWIQKNVEILPKMVKIEAGEFWLGSGKESSLKQEQPALKVHLEEYFIDREPVTNLEYAVFLKKTKYRKPDFWNESWIKKPNHSVVGVSWEDANNYAKWAGKSLPTEAEWEKAAKGKENRIYPWGEEFDPNLANLATIKEGTKPVGGYPGGASSYGCLDMIGNVTEWCENGYDEKAYKKRELRSRNDPTAEKKVGKTKALRGASWQDSKVFARSAFRFNKPRDTREEYIGFRCVRRKQE